MSIVTNVLNRLGLTATLSAIPLVPKARLRRPEVSRMHFDAKREWSSAKNFQEFQNEVRARRAFAEAQSKLPLAR